MELVMRSGGGLTRTASLDISFSRWVKRMYSWIARLSDGLPLGYCACENE